MFSSSIKNFTGSQVSGANESLSVTGRYDACKQITFCTLPTKADAQEKPRAGVPSGLGSFASVLAFINEGEPATSVPRYVLGPGTCRW